MSRDVIFKEEIYPFAAQKVRQPEPLFFHTPLLDASDCGDTSYMVEENTEALPDLVQPMHEHEVMPEQVLHKQEAITLEDTSDSSTILIGQSTRKSTRRSNPPVWLKDCHSAH